jgi:hypothetical protein
MPSVPFRRRFAWYYRLVLWAVALPLGLVITARASYSFGLITKDDVLSMFVNHGAGRYTRLASATVAWAVVTALILEVLTLLSSAFVARREQRRARTGGPAEGRDVTSGTNTMAR